MILTKIHLVDIEITDINKNIYIVDIEIGDTNKNTFS